MMEKIILSMRSTIGITTILSLFVLALLVTTPAAFKSRASEGARQGTIPQCSLSFTEINYPEAEFTEAFGINNSNQVVGIFQDSQGGYHGFRLDQGGYTKIDYPGATNTLAGAINDSGVIVGGYTDLLGKAHGFILSDGNYGEIHYPNATTINGHGINNNPDVTGGYSTDGQTFHGYIIRGIQQDRIPIDYPNAAWTQAYGPNDNGNLVGRYKKTANGEFHGYLYRGGGYDPIDVPGAFQTEAFEIDNLGRIVGDFRYSSTDNDHGFRLIGTSYCEIVVPIPGGTSPLTQANGINDNGRIVGGFVDGQGKGHGYVTQ